MQKAHVREIRRRKIAMYETTMPAGTLVETTASDTDDVGYARLLSIVARATSPEFGLEFGQRRRPADLGILGYLITSCATFGEIVELWLSYAEGGGELIEFESDERYRPKCWAVQMTPHPLLSREAADFCLNEMTAAFFSFAKYVTGNVLADFEVELLQAPLPGVDYQRFFPGRVRFNCPVQRLIGPVAALELPVLSQRADDWNVMLEQMVAVERENGLVSGMKLRLYEYFIHRRGAAPCLEGAATALGCSPRTLVRRLRAENTGFGMVLDTYRRQYALALSGDGALKPKQIAHLVGFKSENGLRKAFRQWTGQPIGAFIEAAAEKR